MMTRAEAIALARSKAEDAEWGEAEAEEAFRALYGRRPDRQDREEGLVSHIYAGLPRERKPSSKATCPKCGKTGAASRLKKHLAECKGQKKVTQAGPDSMENTGLATSPAIGEKIPYRGYVIRADKEDPGFFRIEREDGGLLQRRVPNVEHGKRVIDAMHGDDASGEPPQRALPFVPHLPTCGIPSPRHPGGLRCDTACPHYQDPPLAPQTPEEIAADYGGERLRRGMAAEERRGPSLKSGDKEGKN